MKIICICGITATKRKQRMWKYMQIAFSVYYPDATFVIVHKWYLAWQWAKIRDFVRSIVSEHDTGEEVIIVGHSLGGIVACAVASCMSRSPVRGIITVFSPHSFLFGLFRKNIVRFSARMCSIPLVSFRARYDHLVLWGSEHAESVHHKLLSTGHVYSLIRSPHWWRVIASESKKFIS